MALFGRKTKGKKSTKKTSSASKTKSGGKSTLTKKQRDQRKYAAQMKGVRKRASKTRGGSGLIAEREAAAKLRREYGLKGPTKKKATKRKSAKKKSGKK
jgi:hypothetical protein